MKTNIFLKVIAGVLLLTSLVGCGKKEKSNVTGQIYGQYTMDMYGRCIDSRSGQPAPSSSYCMNSGGGNGQYILGQNGQCIDRYTNQPVQPQLCQQNGAGGGQQQCVGQYSYGAPMPYGETGYCNPSYNGMPNNCSGYQLYNQAGQLVYCM
jgi:hypothetical protein